MHNIERRFLHIGSGQGTLLTIINTWLKIWHSTEGVIAVRWQEDGESRRCFLGQGVEHYLGMHGMAQDKVPTIQDFAGHMHLITALM